MLEGETHTKNESIATPFLECVYEERRMGRWDDETPEKKEGGVFEMATPFSNNGWKISEEEKRERGKNWE